MFAAVALYGASFSRVRAADLFERTRRAFGRWNCPLHRIFFLERGSKRDRRLRPKSAPTKLASLSVDALQYIGFSSLEFEASTNVRDYEAEVSFLPYMSMAHISLSCEYADLTTQGLGGWVREMLPLLKPEYGIGYRRPWALGPGWYPSGIIQGLPDGSSECERISRWGNRGMSEKVWRTGLIRDVYPWNLLNANQLDRKVGTRSLQAWISADSSRGTLEDAGSGLTWWRVRNDRLRSVGAVLEEYGFTVQAPKPLSKAERGDLTARIIVNEYVAALKRNKPRELQELRSRMRSPYEPLLEPCIRVIREALACKDHPKFVKAGLEHCLKLISR